MPLIVEDGTMPIGANTYISLEFSDAYLVPRGLWPATKSKTDDESGDNEENEGIEQPDSPVAPDNPESGEIETQSEEENGGETDLESPEPEEPAPEPALPDTSKPADDPAIAKKETALMRAFDYLNTLKWKGQRIDWQRQIAWPRVNVPIPGSCSETRQFIPDDIVPDAVKQAQMELAALIYNGVDMFKPLERGGQYQQQSDSFSKGVDVLSKSESHSVAYASNAPKDTWLPSVYPLLRDFLDEIPGETNSFTVHNVLRG